MEEKDIRYLLNVKKLDKLFVLVNITLEINIKTHTQANLMCEWSIHMSWKSLLMSSHSGYQLAQNNIAIILSLVLALRSSSCCKVSSLISLLYPLANAGIIVYSINRF